MGLREEREEGGGSVGVWERGRKEGRENEEGMKEGERKGGRK